MRWNSPSRTTSAATFSRSLSIGMISEIRGMLRHSTAATRRIRHRGGRYPVPPEAPGYVHSRKYRFADGAGRREPRGGYPESLRSGGGTSRRWRAGDPGPRVARHRDRLRRRGTGAPLRAPAARGMGSREYMARTRAVVLPDARVRIPTAAAASVAQRSSLAARAGRHLGFRVGLRGAPDWQVRRDAMGGCAVPRATGSVAPREPRHGAAALGRALAWALRRRQPRRGTSVRRARRP